MPAVQKVHGFVALNVILGSIVAMHAVLPTGMP